MELPSEVQVALAAFVAVLAANALKWASRFISNYVRGTPNQLDDKIWAAVRDVMNQIVDEDLTEREVDLVEREIAIEDKEHNFQDREEQVDADALKWARDNEPSKEESG